jgi:hypothetical protein
MMVLGTGEALSEAGHRLDGDNGAGSPSEASRHVGREAVSVAVLVLVFAPQVR